MTSPDLGRGCRLDFGRWPAIRLSRLVDQHACGHHRHSHQVARVLDFFAAGDLLRLRGHDRPLSWTCRHVKQCLQAIAILCLLSSSRYAFIMSENSTTSPNKKRRWRFRFSLRTFLILVIVLSICLGWLGNFLLRVRHKRNIVEPIRSRGRVVLYEYEWHNNLDGATNPPPGPKFIRRISVTTHSQMFFACTPTLQTKLQMPIWKSFLPCRGSNC